MRVLYVKSIIQRVNTIQASGAVEVTWIIELISGAMMLLAAPLMLVLHLLCIYPLPV